MVESTRAWPAMSSPLNRSEAAIDIDSLPDRIHPSMAMRYDASGPVTCSTKAAKRVGWPGLGDGVGAGEGDVVGDATGVGAAVASTWMGPVGEVDAEPCAAAKAFAVAAP